MARTETVDGVKVERLGGIHSLWLTTFIRYMARHRGKFDVVVAEGFGGSRIPRLTPLYVKEPLITEWHQIHRDLFAVQYPAILNPPLNLLEHMTAWIHRNTLVRAGTEEWRAAFPTLGFKPANIFVVPVSIRDDWLDGQNGSASSEPVILWLGKLRRYKCPDHAIEALPAVRRVVTGARLIIAGRRDDPKYERELRAQVARLGLSDYVDFRFDLTETEKLRVLQDSRVLVVPSVVEGFGIVVLEANAFGLPVVASSGVPEGAVAEGVNGLRYQFGNIPALSAAIVRTLQDRDLYARLSQQGRERARDYTWSRVGPQFERVVARSAARPE